MADWKKLAKALALSDGRLDTKETEIIKRELYADGRLDKSEIEFLVDLRKTATERVQVFDAFFFDVLKKLILADGDISDAEAKWLRKIVFADGSIDAVEKTFLTTLKTEAKQVGKEFEALCKDAGV
jgi:uncharacterized tellurite resistance protein B-like protein